MSRHRAVLLAASLLGCGREVAPGPVATEPPPLLRAPIESAAPKPVAQASAPIVAPRPARRFVLVELAPTQGDLQPLLRAEAARAGEKALRPVVEFYADWCAPCRAFQENMGDPRIAEALEGTYLVKLNLDDWHDKLAGTGFAVKTIPSFYVLGAEGRPSGRMLDGDKWGRSTPERMGAALKAFFEG